uniref:Uncharacterized protein n=1 Tax=viral metagenome TaxID=1070528 RepID=A0A6C0D339_9ZZZZ
MNHEYSDSNPYNYDSQFLYVLFISAILLLIYIVSGYNETYFRLVNFLFYLSFTISLYSFYLQDKQERTDKTMKYITTILVELYELEIMTYSSPSQLSHILLLLEKIYLIEPSLAKPDRLGIRLHRLTQVPHFQNFWKSNQSLYNPSFREFVSDISSNRLE